MYSVGKTQPTTTPVRQQANILSSLQVLILNVQCGKNPANNHTSQAASQHSQLTAKFSQSSLKLHCAHTAGWSYKI